MKIKSAELPTIYIPEFNGNKDLPTDEQIVVHVNKHISNLQLAGYKKFEFDGAKTSVKYDNIAIFRYHVGKIDNLEDGKGKIDSGVKLADSTTKELYDLMIEIRDWLINVSEPLPEGESKASE